MFTNCDNGLFQIVTSFITNCDVITNYDRTELFFIQIIPNSCSSKTIAVDFRSIRLSAPLCSSEIKAQDINMEQTEMRDVKRNDIKPVTSCSKRCTIDYETV